MTDGALEMVGATTFSALASEPVRTSLFHDPETPIPHTKMGQAADLVLERGGSADAMELFKQFRGREPSVEPLLRAAGLLVG